jgi:multidrug resistance protein
MSEPPASKHERPNKTLLLTLFSIIVIDLIGFGIVIPVLPFYAEFYGASATVLGMLLTSYAAMQFLFAPIWGRISDRIGRRPVLILTILGSSFALLILGMANSLFWLFVARILGGVFGANISVATAYVTDVTTEKNRTRWMGMIGASFGIGFILGPAIGGLLAPYGYGVPMLFASALALINFIYACFVLKEPMRHQISVENVLHTKLFQNHVIRRICGINLLFTLGVTQLEAIFAFYMMDRFSYDAREVAYILVMMAVIMVGIQGGAIRGLAKRFGEKNLLLVGAVLLALSYAVIPWMPKVALLLIPLASAAIGRGMAQPSMLSLVSSASSAQNRGSVMGIFQSSASLGRIIGPSVAGILYDRFFGIPFLFGTAMMIAVFAVAAGLAIKSPHDVTLEEGEIALE